MTKQQAKETVEAAGAKVLSVRLRSGKPIVSVGWRDYLKVSDFTHRYYDEFEISIRSK
jgi:hypothetical protein